MSATRVLSPQNTKSGVFSFLNNFAFNRFISTKEPTKDEDWQKHYNNYQNLCDNLDLHQLDGFLSKKRSKTNIDIDSLVSGSFVQNPDVAYLTCMDEGVQYISTSKNVIPIAVPGCGVLMASQQGELRNKILDVLNSFSIKKLVVDSHAKCGAAGIAAKTEFANLSCIHSKAFMEKLTELVADDYAHLLADNLHEDFADLEVSSNYITKLDRPDFHNAMGVVVNFEPSLNSSLLINKLKVPLFALSAFVLDNDVLAEDDLLAYKIATGSHGFEDRFTKEKPFLIIFTIKSEDHKAQALKIISKIESNNFIQYSFLKV